MLEDDLGVSPCFYTYLLRARRAYGHRPELSGFTLQSVPLCFLDQGCDEPEYEAGRPTLNPVVGSWGFMPRPEAWASFLAWQADAAARGVDPSAALPKGFRPSRWYADLVASNRTETMWTIWHIAYTASHNLSTLTPHFSEPLAYVHGSQPSEHGNPPDRRPAARLAAATMLAALQPFTPPPPTLGRPAATLLAAASDELSDEMLFEDLLLDCQQLVPACTRTPSELVAYGFDGAVLLANGSRD